MSLSIFGKMSFVIAIDKISVGHVKPGNPHAAGIDDCFDIPAKVLTQIPA